MFRRILPILALATVLLAPAGADAARPEAAARIVGGTTSSTGAWPAQVHVSLTLLSDTYVCGGTLVSARWVLTAGHCAADDLGLAPAASAYTLHLGSNQAGGGTRHLVDEVIRHPGYTGDPPVNDLALLHLATPAAQEPLQLIRPAETPAWAAGIPATVVGWGTTEGGTLSTTLRQAQVPMVADATCGGQDVWGSFFDASTMVCAGGGDSDTCGGDSGGPLMVPRAGGYALVGVTSWGAVDCGTPGVPGVYARLGASALNAWVRAGIPTVSLSPSTPNPAPDQAFSLTASTTQPASQTGTPAFAWDLDNDGAFDDATGPTASASYPTNGTRVVRVQSTYAPDGDRAVTREVLTIGQGDPAPVQPPAPVQQPVAPPLVPPTPRPAAPAPLRPTATATAPSSMRLATLRRRGLKVRFTCSRSCSATARLTVSATVARRLRLKVRTIATGRGSISAAGTSAMNVRLTRQAKRRLRSSKRLRLALRTTLTAGSLMQRDVRVVTARPS